ncbi:helix-turn-helix transcriptional regulator [Variovorax sp. Varisp85]|jgi:predicted ArsR family transcriptional regulator|uniref:helix-turn-helix transcriptional regulator n=1 Tax=unclassified Variovorax TaxID=663243 RepID=UPI000270EC61|nr:metalloregulator ArsR/SmtB family transcription factor [Variovorax sp. CF313]EJL69380.1 putative transcriptional regulator [Variovorax sp. CF313]
MPAPIDAKPAWLPHQPADRILSTLKTRGALGIPDIAKVLKVTVEAVRQQMVKLEADGLVDAQSRPGGRGRPTQIWRLTGEGHKRFPDTHAEMTVQMISAVIRVFGNTGMDQLIAAREDTMRANYAEALRGARSLQTRLERLADIRSREGYMAEFRPEGDGFLFIENHCPICTAAQACTGFCRSELQLFDAVLGPDVSVSRVEHVLAGARRCAYQVSPRQGT